MELTKDTQIIFLDIDGVLNCAKTMQRHRGVIGIDPYMVAIFNRIIFATDAKIVLSSTWRLHKDERDEIRSQVMDFIDVTPHLPLKNGYERKERGCEVKAWLKEHPEITTYAILDDNSDFFPDQPLFKSSWQIGLTEDIAKDVIKHLNK